MLNSMSLLLKVAQMVPLRNENAKKLIVNRNHPFRKSVASVKSEIVCSGPLPGDTRRVLLRSSTHLAMVQSDVPAPLREDREYGPLTQYPPVQELKRQVSG